MKAIETVYKGYRFRSRLEARWAVVLDTLGVPYDYEKEGYDLGETGYYLPDFWIPDWGMFIEIKPDADMTREVYAKPQRLCESSGKRVLLVMGQPWHGEYKGLLFRDEDGEVVGTGFWEFGQCRKCDALYLGADNWGAFSLTSDPCDTEKWPLIGAVSDKVTAAFEAARGARFEHGESGAKKSAPVFTYQTNATAKLRDRVAWVLRMAGPRTVRALSGELFAREDAISETLHGNEDLFLEQADGIWTSREGLFPSPSEMLRQKIAKQKLNQARIGRRIAD